MERIEQLVDSANKSDVLRGCPISTDECELVFDYGWTHGIEVVTRGFFLVEKENTGWVVVNDREELGRFINAQ